MAIRSTSLSAAAVAAALLAAALVSGCQPAGDEAHAAATADEPAPAAPTRPAPVVSAMAVRAVSMAEVHSYTGTVEPRRSVAESFRVGGKLVARLVDVGDRVAAGTVIARLDPTDFDLALAKAEAALSAATTNRDRAAADERRGADLLAKGHATAADYDGRRLALAEAAARLEQAARELDLARNQRAYADLVASADGVVSAIGAEPGQVVTAGAPIATLAETAAPEVRVAIPESRIGGLDGASADVSLWAGGHAYAARLREIAPAADPVTRTYAARFAIDAPDDAVRFGMTATVTLTRGDPRKVVLVPPTAVLDEGRGPVVFVIDPSGSPVRERPVEVLRYAGEAVVIAAGGLHDGERIVALGVNRLDDGEAVRVGVETATLAP